jgi:hypothetical protein
MRRRRSGLVWNRALKLTAVKPTHAEAAHECGDWREQRGICMPVISNIIMHATQPDAFEHGLRIQLARCSSVCLGADAS